MNFNETIPSLPSQRRPCLALCPMPADLAGNRVGASRTRGVPGPAPRNGWYCLYCICGGRCTPKQKQKEREEFGSFLIGWQGGGVGMEGQKKWGAENVPTAPFPIWRSYSQVEGASSASPKVSVIVAAGLSLCLLCPLHQVLARLLSAWHPPRLSPTLVDDVQRLQPEPFISLVIAVNVDKSHTRLLALPACLPLCHSFACC